MAQLHLYSSDHKILLSSQGRAQRAGYVSKFENAARDQGFPTRISTDPERRARALCSGRRCQTSELGARLASPARSFPDNALAAHERRSPGPQHSLPRFFVKKPQPRLHREQPIFPNATGRQPPGTRQRAAATFLSRLPLPGDGKSGQALPRVTCLVLFLPL